MICRFRGKAAWLILWPLNIMSGYPVIQIPQYRNPVVFQELYMAGLSLFEILGTMMYTKYLYFSRGNIRIGPDRAYPLHFTHPQLLLPVLLPVLLGQNLFLFVFEPYPLKLSNFRPLIIIVIIIIYNGQWQNQVPLSVNDYNDSNSSKFLSLLTG